LLGEARPDWRIKAGAPGQQTGTELGADAALFNEPSALLMILRFAIAKASMSATAIALKVLEERGQPHRFDR
jgi:hypothetical protein